VKHFIPHSLSTADAKRVIESAFAEYATRFAKYAPRLKWLSEDAARVGFQAMGRELEGSVRVLQGGIEVEADVPLLVRPFVGRAKQAIEREVLRHVTAFQARGRAG
jgi:hypothetical protein